MVEEEQQRITDGCCDQVAFNNVYILLSHGNYGAAMTLISSFLKGICDTLSLKGYDVLEAGSILSYRTRDKEKNRKFLNHYTSLTDAIFAFLNRISFEEFIISYDDYLFDVEVMLPFVSSLSEMVIKIDLYLKMFEKNLIINPNSREEILLKLLKRVIVKDYNTLSDLYGGCRKLLAEVSIEHENLIKQNADLKKENYTLDSNNSRLLKELAAQRRLILDFKTQSVTLENTKYNLTQKLSSYKSTLDCYTNRIDLLQRDNAKLSELNVKLGETLELKETLLSSLHPDTPSSDTDSQNEPDEFHKFKEYAEIQLSYLNLKLAKKNQLIRQSDEQLKVYKDLFDSHESEIEKYIDQVDRFKSLPSTMLNAHNKSLKEVFDILSLLFKEMKVRSFDEFTERIKDCIQFESGTPSQNMSHELESMLKLVGVSSLDGASDLFDQINSTFKVNSLRDLLANKRQTEGRFSTSSPIKRSNQEKKRRGGFNSFSSSIENDNKRRKRLHSDESKLSSFFNSILYRNLQTSPTTSNETVTQSVDNLSWDSFGNNYLAEDNANTVKRVSKRELESSSLESIQDLSIQDVNSHPTIPTTMGAQLEEEMDEDSQNKSLHSY
jgi:hypothetical protein